MLVSLVCLVCRDPPDASTSESEDSTAASVVVVDDQDDSSDGPSPGTTVLHHVETKCLDKKDLIHTVQYILKWG